MTAGDLERMTRWLVDRLGLPADEVALDPVYVRVPVGGRSDEAPEPELLNSSFLEDLARVRSAFQSGQGKEAEAVVLVLGAPAPQAAGARRWAGGEPNLLNVAASRAKRRLYVIGDRRSWRAAGVFRTLAAHLPEKEMG